MTSALGGTMIPSSEEPAQYTIRSTYCQLLNVFTKYSSSPREGTPLVFEFNAANATSLLLDCALSFTLYNSSRVANGTRLRLNSASESLSGDQFNNSSGYQSDYSDCSAKLKFGHMNVIAIINLIVIY